MMSFIVYAVDDRRTLIQIASDRVSRIGSVMVTRQPSSHYYYVSELSVQSSYRHRRIGTVLMKEVINRFGMYRLELVPTSTGEWDNETLANWYRQFEFENSPTAATREWRDSDARRMARNPRAVEYIVEWPDANAEHPHDYGDYSDVQ